YLFVSSYNDVLAMGVLLGIAGASFGVALSLGSGWFPPEHKGLAMGIAGAGNSGTVLAVLFAPPLAQAYGWQTTYAFAGVVMLLPLAIMIVL
ncbi:MFS transporter, partial [Escherichia coli]|nr:MFS transporter [Escherichia coli]